MQRQIRNSAKALVIKDGKMLALRLTDMDGDFYIMPGGGQHAEESLTDAARREVAEETGLDVLPIELAFIIEGMRGETFHRVDMVFLCELLGTREDTAKQYDVNQQGFEWLDIASLNAQPLYPSKLRRPIMRLYEGKPHPIYLGNENMGDPDAE